jgi:DNA repair exonuclease SbcCD ATPase subunit
MAPPPPAGPYSVLIPNTRVLVKNARAMALLKEQMARTMALDGKALRYGFFNDGDSYAYVTGEGEKGIHYSGNWYDGSREEIEKARKVAHGDFLWFERDGKSYVIDDPAVLAPLKPMQEQMDELGRQQEELGKQQEELGKKQEALGQQMEQLKVPTPDMQKELAKLQAVQAKLSALQGKDASQEQLAEIQGELADVQGRLGALQGDMGGRMGDLGGKMGELGGQQGKLGAEQGRLGAQQGRIAREMDGKVLSIIDESLKNAKARPVQ